MDFIPINSILYKELKVGTKYVFNNRTYINEEREGILIYKNQLIILVFS